MDASFRRIYRLLAWVVCLNLALASCQTKYEVPENPPPIPKCEAPAPVRLALVLGGGGARGMAHVGVLKEFERACIPIDVIVGCSAGAIVGALYAEYQDAKCVRHLLQPLKKWDVLDINIWYSRYGLSQGGSLRRFLGYNLKSRYFHQLSIPLYVVASDLLSGDLVTLCQGPIIPAVHASAAVPFVFAPVQLYGRLLVDGGVVDPIPVCVAKELGAQVIVAVDLSELLPKTCPTNLFGVASRSAEIKWLAQSESCVKDADIIIRPDLGDIGMFDDKRNYAAYLAGRKAAQEAIPRILEALDALQTNCCK